MARLALDATNYRVGLRAFLQTRAQNILHCLKIPITRRKLSEDGSNLNKIEVLKFIHENVKLRGS